MDLDLNEVSRVSAPRIFEFTIAVYIPGATYFFTVVTHQRQPLFQEASNVQLLRDAFHHVKQRYPFTIDAIVVLPEHIHAVWRLPASEADFSMRWRLIKEYFTRRCKEAANLQRSPSRLKKGEQSIWQRRFWEHQIRDEQDFINHVDYIHYNPVKHGWVKRPGAWPYSSFERYVKAGVYGEDWGSAIAPVFPENVGFE